jgi:hypothetical protein
VELPVRLPPRDRAGAGPRGNMPPAVPRRLATLAAVASLLLCVATVALWVRSYWRSDAASRREYFAEQLRARTLYLHQALGQIVVNTSSTSNASSEVHSHHLGWRFRSQDVGPIDERTIERFRGDPQARFLAGFGFMVINLGASKLHFIIVPHWFFVLLFAILPVVRLYVAFRSRGRQPIGRCPACGYDLRATPARCPECGAVPAASPAR